MAISLKPFSEQVMPVGWASIGLATAEPGPKLVLAARSEETLRELYRRGESGPTRGSSPASPGADPSGNVR